MTFIKYSICALAMAATSVFATQTEAKTLAPFLVFGDSLSDAGYFAGNQSTNGDTWARQLGSTTAPFSPTYNFAQGGARFIDPDPAITAPPDGFNEQITRFQTTAPAINPGTTAVVWFGGNDIIGATLAASSLIDITDPTAVNAYYTALVTDLSAALFAGVSRLNALNVNNFIIAGLSDLSLYPLLNDPRFSQFLPFASPLTMQYNNAIATTTALLNASPTINAQFFDTAAIYNGIIAGSPVNGFNPPFNASCTGDGDGINCDGFIFFDGVHPTEAVHSVLAAEFADRLPPVPLPAGAVLLISAIGVLAIARRRQPAI